MMRLFALLILLLTTPAAAQSTINPTVPAEGTPLNSAPVRNNFVAAYNDINTLYGITTTLQNQYNVTNNWNALQTFNGGIKVNGPGPSGIGFAAVDVNSGNNCATGCNASIFAGNALSGTSGSQIFWNNWAVNDAVVLTAPNPFVMLYLNDQLNSASAKGYRLALLSTINQTVVTANGTANGNYVGVTGIVQTSSGDGGSGGTYQGAYFGGNFWCGNGAVGGNLAICTSAEFDNYGVTGATQKYKFGINIADGNPSTASLWDSAIAVYTLGAASPYAQGRGWQCVLCVGDIASSGFQPLSGTGTIIGTHMETITSVNTAFGIDWTNAHFSTAFAKWQNGLIDNLGSMILGANTGGVHSANFTTLNLLAGSAGSLISLQGNGFEYARLQASVAGPNFYMLMGNSAAWNIGTTAGATWGVWTASSLTLSLGNFNISAGLISSVGPLVSAGTPPVGTTGTCTSGVTVVGGAFNGTWTSTSACNIGGTIIISSMPSVVTGYACNATDRTTAGVVLQQTASSVTSATFTVRATNASANDIIQFNCTAY